MSLFDNENNEFDNSIIQLDNLYSSDFPILNRIEESYVFTYSTGVPVCVHPDTLILMHDNSVKMIKDIRRGDIVIQDIKTNKTAIVSVVIITPPVELVIIPSGLLDNKSDLIITFNHPVWINNDNDRIMPKNINGVIKYDNYLEYVYNLQFDEEGTFYANDIKIDSLTPYQATYPLSKDNFIDINKYQEGIIISDENDPRRNKPVLLQDCKIRRKKRRPTKK